MANRYEFFQSTGVIVPDTSDILAEVQEEYRAAFGADLRVSSDTPQGVLIAAEVSARAGAAQINAQVANQINPNLSEGLFLDAVCALLGLERSSATRTLVSGVVLTGVAGTFVPFGTRVRTTTGALFELIDSVVITQSAPGPASAAALFQAVEPGPVVCGVGELDTIVDGVLGLETVSNPNAGVLGELQRSDQALRALRNRTLALQGRSTPEAVVSSVSNLPGVRSLQFRENITNVTAVIDGITLLAHSIWLCVDGGVNADIALALLNSKTAGANYNGAVTVAVVEPASMQSYNVKFDRPQIVPVLAQVTVRKGTFTGDITAAVRAAILDYAAGKIEGEEGFVVGGDVSPFEIAGAVSRAAPGLFVQKVEVTTVAANTLQTTHIDLALNQLASIADSSITVVVV